MSGLYRDEAVVLRTQKLGEADRIITLLTRSNGRVRAVGKGVRRTSLAVRCPARAVQPRRRPAAPRPQPRRRHAGGVLARLRRAASSTTTPATRRGRPCSRRPNASRRRSATRRPSSTSCSSAGCGPWRPRSTSPVSSSTPSCSGAGGRPAGRRASTHCAMCGAEGPAPVVLRQRRRCDVRRLPAVGCCDPGTGDRWSCSARCSPATGRSPTRATCATAARATAWSPRSSSGTSSAACARCALVERA